MMGLNPSWAHGVHPNQGLLDDLHANLKIGSDGRSSSGHSWTTPSKKKIYQPTYSCKTPETQEEMEQAMQNLSRDASDANDYDFLNLQYCDSRQTSGETDTGGSMGDVSTSERQMSSGPDSSGEDSNRRSRQTSATSGHKQQQQHQKQQQQQQMQMHEKEVVDPQKADEEANWGAADGPTAVMIRNLPLKCDGDALAAQVEAAGFKDLFLEIHVPSNRDRTFFAGYGFINFKDPLSAFAFKSAVEGTVLREPSLGEPRGELRVHPAAKGCCVKGDKGDTKRPNRRGYGRRGGDKKSRSKEERLAEDSTTNNIMEPEKKAGKKTPEQGTAQDPSPSAARTGLKFPAAPPTTAKKCKFCMFCGTQRHEFGHSFCPFCGKKYAC